MPLRAFIFFVLFLTALNANGQSIRGEVVDGNDGKPMANVAVINVYNNSGYTTGDDGRFLVTANKSELIEFRKLGYKIARVRIPAGSVPEYFKIILQRGPIELPEVNIAGRAKDYKSDSLRFHDIYKHELEFPTMSTLDMIQHPFTALSKTNRQIWHFQKEYERFQKEKYIDYTFNEKLVTNLTGLAGDSLERYMRYYRPAYEQLRNMSDYSFYSYIKQTVYRYRLANSPSRTTQ